MLYVCILHGHVNTCFFVSHWFSEVAGIQRPYTGCTESRAVVIVKVYLIRVGDDGGCVSMESNVWVDLSLSRDSIHAGVDGESA